MQMSSINTEPGLSIKKALSIWQWRIKRFHKLEVVLLGNHDPCLPDNRVEWEARGSESSRLRAKCACFCVRKEGDCSGRLSNHVTRTAVRPSDRPCWRAGRVEALTGV
jgi:hypothetical protein